tara:strand:- start:305 stop:718 length:414 start_codon:yes stop_codon:yes gene_type:complete
MSKIQLYREVIEFSNDVLEIDCKDFQQELFDRLANYNDDFEVDHGRSESYRFISDTAIEDIHVESVKDMVTDCYLSGTDLDKYSWIAIDWEETAENLRSSDGYGHHFSGYDGSEEEYDFTDVEGSGVKFGYWIFRTN